MVYTVLIVKKILIFKEIQMGSGSGAKSYMRKGFLIYEEMRKYFNICMRRPLVIQYMTLHSIPLNFLIYEENLIFFFTRAVCTSMYLHSSIDMY